VSKDSKDRIHPVVEVLEDNIHPVAEVSENNINPVAVVSEVNQNQIMSNDDSSTSSTVNNSLIKDVNIEKKRKRKIRKLVYSNSQNEIILNSDLDMVYAERRTKTVERVDQVTSPDTINIKHEEPMSETLKINTVENPSNLTEQITGGLKNPTTNDVSSVSERIKKSSSETKRRSLLGTWFYSTSDMSENTNENEDSKPSDVALSTHTFPKSTSSPDLSTSPASNLTTSSNSKPSTTINLPSKVDHSTQNTSTPINNTPPTSSQASTKGYTSNSSSKKPVSNQRSNIKNLPPNPLVQTLPGNRSSWLHFFVSGPPARSGISKIKQRSDVKLISDVEIVSKGETPEMTSINNNTTSLKVSTQNEIDKKVSTSQTISDSSPKLKPSAVKPVPVSIVLPKFDESAINTPMRHPDSPVQKALHAINSYFFPPDKPRDGTLHKWLDEITRSTIDVKRIAIIGVHGWFPAKLLRVVVGEPTGTSVKFCDMMAKAVLGYLSKHNISLPSDAITCIPLEGEGTIETREQLLHKNLLYNKTWCEALTLADVVFVATHSQGTPVGTILLSRLIKERLVNPKQQRICLLAMAGISHGPFPYLKEHYILRYFVGAGRNPDVDASRELFEFIDSESTVAKKYREALNVVTQKGVKLVYVASMDDQVVPLYSGIFIGIEHPSILRAIYVDGPLYQENDFLINLIIFAIKLRNAGILDHGLITQLSEVIIGSLYGEGHSALYNEIDVYTLAVQYLFEVPSVKTSQVKLKKFQAQQKNNPYYLPWSVRGILEDQNVIKNPHFASEINRLKKLYEDWDPSSKVLKELKFRLEPFRDTILGK
ncbi:3325_t:CDS:2, partial [Scutellospora calospora]